MGGPSLGHAGDLSRAASLRPQEGPPRAVEAFRGRFVVRYVNHIAVIFTLNQDSATNASAAALRAPCV